jgi:hypothetical protein
MRSRGAGPADKLAYARLLELLTRIRDYCCEAVRTGERPACSRISPPPNFPSKKILK